MLFPVGLSMALLGKPSPKSPPMPGNRLEDPDVDPFPFTLPRLEPLDDDPLFVGEVLLFELLPPVKGAERSFVTVFFKAFPC